MSPEHRAQLYGGDISNYLVPEPLVARQYEDPIQTDKNIGDIYAAQVQGKKSIDTTGLYSVNFSSPKIQKDSQINKLEQLLNQTLNTIAQELGLADIKHDQKISNTLNFKTQTDNDIAAANQRVLQAMKELEAISNPTSDLPT